MRIKFKRVKRVVETPNGVRPYHGLNTALTYQNFGSVWLCILRGKPEDIELAFNGLFNLCGTNGTVIANGKEDTAGELEFDNRDDISGVATFWTSRNALRRFFFNRYFMSRCADDPTVKQGALVRRAMRYALARLAKLRKWGHEAFLDYSQVYDAAEHAFGQVSAERPDSDFKDAVLQHAFTPNYETRYEKQLEKVDA